MMENSFFSVHLRGENPSDDRMEWLISGLVPKVGVGLILGPSRVGKSLLALWMSSCLATSQPFVYVDKDVYPCGAKLPHEFGYALEKGASIYFSGEGGSDIAQRIQGAESAIPEEFKNSLPQIVGPLIHEKGLPIIDIRRKGRKVSGVDQIPIFLNETELSRVMYEVQGYRPALIVLDTLVSVYEIEQLNDNSEMQCVMDTLHKLAQDLQCFVFAVVHPSKSKKADQNYSKGAGAIFESADVVLKLGKVNSTTQRKMIVVKSRYSAAEGMEFKFNILSCEGNPAMVPIQPRLNEQVLDASENSGNNFKRKLGLTANHRRIFEIIKLLEKDGVASKKNILNELIRLDKIEAGANGKSLAEQATLTKQIDRAIKFLSDKDMVISNINENGENVFMESKTSTLVGLPVGELSGTEE